MTTIIKFSQKHLQRIIFGLKATFQLVKLTFVTVRFLLISSVGLILQKCRHFKVSIKSLLVRILAPFPNFKKHMKSLSRCFKVKINSGLLKSSSENISFSSQVILHLCSQPELYSILLRIINRYPALKIKAAFIKNTDNINFATDLPSPREEKIYKKIFFLIKNTSEN